MIGYNVARANEPSWSWSTDLLEEAETYAAHFSARHGVPYSVTRGRAPVAAARRRRAECARNGESFAEWLGRQ